MFRGIPKNKMDYDMMSKTFPDNFVDGFAIGDLVSDARSDRAFIVISSMTKLKCNINNMIATAIEVIPETIGEWTGVTDDNGKLLFEGDIVNATCSDLKGDDVEKTIEVGHYIYPEIEWANNIKIVGNKHHNDANIDEKARTMAEQINKDCSACPVKSCNGFCHDSIENFLKEGE